MGPEEPFSDDVRFPRQPDGGYGPPGPPEPAPAYGGPPLPLLPSFRSRLLARLRGLFSQR